VIATLCAQHGLPPLTDRDAASRTLVSALTRSTARPISSWPVVVPPRVPIPPSPLASARGHVPAATGLGLVGLVLDRFAPGAPRPADLPSAFDTLADHGAGLFGTRDPRPVRAMPARQM
jgi:phospholipase C